MRVLAVLVLVALSISASADELKWFDNYKDAYHAAKEQKSRLFIAVTSNDLDFRPSEKLARILKDGKYVVAKIDSGEEVVTTIASPESKEVGFVPKSVESKKTVTVKIFEQGQFSDLDGKKGIAILDFRSGDEGKYVIVLPEWASKSMTDIEIAASLPEGDSVPLTFLWALKRHSRIGREVAFDRFDSKASREMSQRIERSGDISRLTTAFTGPQIGVYGVVRLSAESLADTAYRAADASLSHQADLIRALRTERFSLALVGVEGSANFVIRGR